MHEENNNQIAEEVSTPKNSVSKFQLTMPKAIVIAGILIAGSVVFSQTTLNRGAALQEASARLAEGGGNGASLVTEVNDDDDFIRGAKKPKVTIVEFSDFGCSFCASFHPTLRDIVNKYPDDVAWVYRHLPFRNNEAALAAECVGQELGDEAFWSYSDEIFANYPDITNELLASEAIKLGFKSEADFWECQGREEVAERVSENAAEARLMGATGTPHSVIISEDGKSFPLRGAAAFEQIDKIISLLVEE